MKQGDWGIGRLEDWGIGGLGDWGIGGLEAATKKSP
jgi:hypothetical protein